MAARRNAQAAELMEAEQAERAENADINEAIARTDSEVFTDALGNEPLEDDAGTELEDMGEGLEGEELDEEGKEEKPPEGEGEVAPPEGEEAAVEAEGEGEQPEGEAEGEPPAAEQRPPPSIPPRVLRETRERARETENELRAQLRDMQLRIDNLSRQPPPQPQPAQPQPQPAPQQAPDMFADPEGYRNWVLNEAERRADARFNDRFGQYQQQQQRDQETRLNESLAQTAQGPRSYEFNVAYRDLTSLDKTPENAAIVRRIVTQPDPGQAILDWWETSSNPDYIEYHRDQVRQTYGTPGRPQRNGGPLRQNGSRGPVQNRQVPRHEVRLPRSLSEATGGRSQHVNDPDMFDGAEDSIFAYGARR